MSRNLQLKNARLARGWTQDDAANEINAAFEYVNGRPGAIRGEYVRRLEAGEVGWPQKPLRQAIAAAYRVKDLTDLGFRPTRRRTDTKDEDDVQRLDFLRGVAAVGGAALMSGSLRAALDSAIGPIPAPRLVGPEHVAEVSQMVETVRRADHLGHPFGQRVMGAQMHHTLDLLDATADPEVKLNLHAAAATLADAIGWSLFDAGHHRAANQLFQVGLHCATEAGSFRLRADILSDMARQAIHLGRPDDALTLLGLAQVRQDRISHLRRANLSAVQARAFGILGDVPETLRAVRDADEHFHDVASGDRDESDYVSFGGYFDYAQLNGDTGHGLFGIAVHGHELAETRHRLRIAAENYGPDWARSRALCLTLDATLALRSGEVEEGVARGLVACDAAAAINSARVADGVRLIVDAAEFHHTPEVAELKTRAQQLI